MSLLDLEDKLITEELLKECGYEKIFRTKSQWNKRFWIPVRDMGFSHMVVVCVLYIDNGWWIRHEDLSRMIQIHTFDDLVAQEQYAIERYKGIYY